MVVSESFYIVVGIMQIVEEACTILVGWAATRDDIQNACRIIGEGPGWISRLREALAAGTLLPALGTLMMQPQDQSSG
jgi:hypothetical protein